MTMILVVEDEPANRRVLTYFLNQEGYQVRAARDGLEALELLAQFQFDLVLSDLKMPRMDGISLARYVISRLPTPILLMSGYDYGDNQSIKDYGLTCLTKPLSLDKLLLAIQKALTGNGAA